MAIIYYIDNKVNWKGYIGCSKTPLSHRYGKHKYLLRDNMHTNRELQEDWNKYGEHNFSAFVIERCSEEEMLERERYHINRLGTNVRGVGYNYK